MDTKTAKIETVQDLIDFLTQFPADSRLRVLHTFYTDTIDDWTAYDDYVDIGGATYDENRNSVVLW